MTESEFLVNERRPKFFRRLLRFNLRTFFVVFTISVCVWWWAEAPSRAVRRFARLLEQHNPDTTVTRVRPFIKRKLGDVWNRRHIYDVYFTIRNDQDNWDMDCSLRFYVNEHGRLFFAGCGAKVTKKSSNLGRGFDFSQQIRQRALPAMLAHGSDINSIENDTFSPSPEHRTIEEYFLENRRR